MGFDFAPLSRPVVLDDDRLERIAPCQLADLGVTEDLDVVTPFDLVDEVHRHLFAEVLTTKEQVDEGCVRDTRPGCLATPLRAPAGFRTCDPRIRRPTALSAVLNSKIA